MIFLLLFSILLLLVIAYFINNKDIMSPSVLLCIIYFISTLGAIYNIEAWNINLHFKTYIIIILGLVSFILGEWFVNLLKWNNKPRKLSGKEINKITPTIIYVQPYKILFTICFQVISLFFYYKEIYRISLYFGGASDLSGVLKNYRLASSYTTQAEGMNTIISQFVNVASVLGYLYLFIFIHNVIYVKSKVTRNIVYLLPVILYGVITFMSASRSELFYLVIAALIMSYILMQKRVNWSINLTFKYIRIGLIFIVIFIGLFSYSRNLVGRSIEYKPIEYVTSYAGGSIQLLDSYTQNPPTSDGHFGSETFIGIQKFFNKIGLSDYQRLYHLEFRNSGSLGGNVYTALRRYYQDFGYIGVFLCQVISAIVYSYFYNMIKRQKSNDSVSNYWVIIYSMLMHGIFMHSITETFFAEMLSIGWLIKFILIGVVYWLVVDLRVKLSRNTMIVFSKK